MMTRLFEYHVGDRVEKYAGDYQCFGVVIARGIKSSGAPRYLVELEQPQGCLMVYGPAQLRIANREGKEFT